MELARTSPSERDCPANHTEYLSEFVASNAVTLHLFQNPTCTTIQAFPCGDHWHIGHVTKAGKAACIAAQATPSGPP